MLKHIFFSIIHHFHKTICFYSRPWLLIGLNIAISALIMIFYEPFGYHFDSWAECTQLIGFCVIAFFSSVLFFLCLPQEPHIKNWMKRWTIGKNCLYSLIFLIITGISISFYDFHLIMQYRAIDYGTHAFYVCLLTDTIGTITIGVVPLCIGLLLEHSFRLKKDLKELRKLHVRQTTKQSSYIDKEEISTDITTEVPSSKETDLKCILLKGDTKEKLEIMPNQILYLEAAGNYVNVYYRKDKVAHKILRTTFRNIEEQLRTYAFLVHFYL